MRQFFINLSRMDRRWVFLGVGVLTVVPFFLPMGLAIKTTRYTQLVYDEIEALRPASDPDSKPILLSMDYDPGTLAELGPMAKAILRHIFSRKGKVIVISFMPTGAGLAKETLDSIAAEFKNQGIEEGVNYAYLGFNTPVAAVMQSIGRDIRDNYPTDTRKVPLDDMPMFKGVRNYDDMHIVIDLAGSNLPAVWITNAVERFGARFAMGVTNVMAADLTPYIPQQAKGMIGGLRGAAEYETMLHDEYGLELGDAVRGMDSQSITHVYILLLILLGNLGYFLSRKKGGAR
ncbi:MAG: hypothetical protein ACC662_01570 [Planctomycetota bacterium]